MIGYMQVQTMVEILGVYHFREHPVRTENLQMLWIFGMFAKETIQLSIVSDFIQLIIEDGLI